MQSRWTFYLWFYEKKRWQVMLLILIKDLVKKRSFCCVEGSDVLGSPSPSTGVFTFGGGGAGTARELRSNLVPRVLSYTERRVWENPGNEVGFARPLACGCRRIFGRRRLRVVPHFPSGIVSGAVEKRRRLSRVGWFSRELAFRSLYYP